MQEQYIGGPLYDAIFCVGINAVCQKAFIMMPAFRVEDGDVTVSVTSLHGVITQKKRVWTANFANKQVMTSPSNGYL